MELNILKYILPEAVVIIVALWVIATVIKRTEKIDNRWIPLILLALSLIFSPLVLGGYTPDNFVQAVLVTGAEMLFYQLWDKTAPLISGKPPESSKDI